MTEYPSKRALDIFQLDEKGYDELEVQRKALLWYGDAKRLGNPRRDKALEAIVKGIACFDSLAEAVQDAEENIKRYTCSNFSEAHFYELVKSMALCQHEKTISVLETDKEPNILFRCCDCGRGKDMEGVWK